MGKWAKRDFGREKIGETGIIIAGTAKPEFEKEVLNLFDRVISSKDSVYHEYLVEKNGITCPVIFNVYGAPAMIDVLTIMHDGGCRNIIFIGYAYGGFKNLDVGSIVLTDKAYHFEGIYHHIEPDRKAAFPDKDLKKKIKELFKKNKIACVEGSNISVPAVTFQLPHNNKEYKSINPLTCEMELASCLSRAKDIGMRAAGILIISDNRKSSIGDETKRKLRHESKIKVLKTITKNISSFNLPRLKIKKEFSIDEHLASIIDNGTEVNVYKNKK